MSADIVVQEALRWIGTPYRHQASVRGAGSDCLGLVRGILRKVEPETDISIPPYGADWRSESREEVLLDAARRYLVAVERDPAPGDVMVFRLRRGLPARHCGVMVATERFVHAQEHLGVIETALNANWTRRLAGLFVFPRTQG